MKMSQYLYLALIILFAFSCNEDTYNTGDQTPPSLQLVLTHNGIEYIADSETNGSIEVNLPKEESYSFKVIGMDEDGVSKSQLQTGPFGIFESNNDYISATDGNANNQVSVLIHEDIFTIDPNYTGTDLLIGGAVTNYGNFQDIQNGTQSEAVNIRINFLSL